MMTPSNMKIRKATASDLDEVVSITKANEHFWTPDVDGPGALARFLERDSNVFLVAETEDRMAGFVLGSWDGARALLHKLSVRPDMQRQGIGSALVREAISDFKKMGAPTVGVTAADGSREGDNLDSTGFWKKVGFEMIPAKLMINFDIWEDD